MGRKSERYRKIKSKKYLERVKDIEWECVLFRSGTPEEIVKSVKLLESFKGCFIKADGVICKLKEAKPPPAWSCILLEGGVQWFALGNYFNIYLPLKQK